MSTIIEMFLQKMGLIDEPYILEKTTELVRLLELRSVNAPLQVNEYGKVALCADIAANLLNIPFDKDHAIRLSAMKKTHYANTKKIYEKLLDLNKTVDINDICIKLNINEVSTKANELLDLYKKAASTVANDFDVTHPQYAAMAIFFACKLKKVKISKPKLMPFSNLKPTQWHLLEKRWDLVISQHYNDSIQNKLKQTAVEAADEIDAAKAKIKQQSKSSNNKKDNVEDYEKWKARILEMAHSKLLLQTQNPIERSSEGIVDDKENMILGL